MAEAPGCLRRARYLITTATRVIADYADNPGAGGYGDSTDLLRALLDAGWTNACFVRWSMVK